MRRESPETTRHAARPSSRSTKCREIMYLARSTQLAIYAMLEIRGIVSCYPRAPFIPATTEEKAHIRSRLQELGLI